MKTKNVRVRTKDLYYGMVVYVSHPVYGIREYQIVGKPYISKLTRAAFVEVGSMNSNGYRHAMSLDDAGIPQGESYNHRRTFRKYKHAEEWAKKMRNDKGFVAAQEKHEQFMSADYGDDCNFDFDCM